MPEWIGQFKMHAFVRHRVDEGDGLRLEIKAIGLPALTVHGHVVTIIDCKGRQHGEMHEPPLAEHEVIAIAGANADMSYIDAGVGCIRIPCLQLIGGLDATALIANARKPRTCRTPLHIALSKGCREGEAAVIEGVIGCEVCHLQRQVALLHTLFHVITSLDVTRQ